MTPIYSIMNRILLLFSSFLIVLAMSSGCQKQVEQQEEDLYVMPERMEEWNDWRFGMFIHWGAWSQTEIGYIWKMVNEEPREIFVDVAGQTLQHKVVGTADWTGNILQVQRQEMDEGERHNNLWLFKDFELGEIKFETAGTYTLVINLSPLLPIALCS